MQIKISSILLPSQDQNILPLYDEVALVTGGKTFLLEASSVIRRFRDVSNALSDLVRDSDGKVIVHETIVTISSTNSHTKGEFLIDSLLGEDTQFVIFVEDQEDHLIKSISFTNTEGNVFGPYTRVATSYDNVNMKTMNYGLNGTPPFAVTNPQGMWRYQVDWFTVPGYQARERQQ